MYRCQVSYGKEGGRAGLMKGWIYRFVKEKRGEMGSAWFEGLRMREREKENRAEMGSVWFEGLRMRE